MEKYKLSTFMIDNILNKYYDGLDIDYLGYEYIIDEDNIYYDLSFNTYYHGKKTLLIMHLTSSEFAKIIKDALIKLNGFKDPFVKITVKDNAVGYSVLYQDNDFGRKRKK